MASQIGPRIERRLTLEAARPRRPAGNSPPTDLVRCTCRFCGCHVYAVVLKQTISGLCGNCGGCDIAPLTA